MFTGIIEEIGRVRHVISNRTSGQISIQADTVLENTRPGDSIAVNGVCLTAAKLLPDGFIADVMPETLRRTNLGALCTDSRVNLERALAADGRFGGHIVSGHIDGTGTIRTVRREENAVWITVEAAPDGKRLRCHRRSQPDCGRTDRAKLSCFSHPPYRRAHDPSHKESRRSGQSGK